ACSSRTTPKPRPPSPTPRPNITFHTYKCPPAYAAWYCLNDATCFTVKIGDSLLYNCECADGYMGPRCEYKDLDGSYLPTRPRVMLETASIASGAIGSLVLIMIGWCCWCVRRHQRHKRLEKENGGVDTVDSAGVLRVVHSEQLLRPFGAHHLKTIPMSEALGKR
ncbi:protein spitz-like, partial [Anopheles bellator]|uniref:protein spitz-like n=1 Tax=Anopheles bellator TaxID=139047 RepID=UPI0026482FFA